MPLETNPGPQSLISSICNTNMADARTSEVGIKFFELFSVTAQSGDFPTEKKQIAGCRVI